MMCNEGQTDFERISDLFHYRSWIMRNRPSSKWMSPPASTAAAAHRRSQCHRQQSDFRQVQRRRLRWNITRERFRTVVVRSRTGSLLRFNGQLRRRGVVCQILAAHVKLIRCAMARAVLEVPSPSLFHAEEYQIYTRWNGERAETQAGQFVDVLAVKAGTTQYFVSQSRENIHRMRRDILCLSGAK
jgi:hypothetical protein